MVKKTQKVQNLRALQNKEITGTDKTVKRDIWKRVAQNENSLATDYPVSGTDRRLAFNINQIVNQIKSVLTQGLDAINSTLASGKKSGVNQVTGSIMSQVSSLWDNLIIYLDYIGFRSMTQRDIQAVYGLFDSIIPLIDQYSDAVDNANEQKIFVPAFKGLVDFREKITNRDLTPLSSLVYSKKDLLNNIQTPNRLKSKEEKLDDNVNLGSLEFIDSILKDLGLEGKTKDQLVRELTIQTGELEKVKNRVAKKESEGKKAQDRDYKSLRSIPVIIRGIKRGIDAYDELQALRMRNEVQSDIQPDFRGEGNFQDMGRRFRASYENIRRPKVEGKDYEENTPIPSQPQSIDDDIDLAQFENEPEIEVEEETVLQPVSSSSSSQPYLQASSVPKPSVPVVKKKGDRYSKFSMKPSQSELNTIQEADDRLAEINLADSQVVEDEFNWAKSEREKAFNAGQDDYVKALDHYMRGLTASPVGARLLQAEGFGRMRNMRRNQTNQFISFVHKGVNQI